jgi:hypothetical protein
MAETKAPFRYWLQVVPADSASGDTIADLHPADGWNVVSESVDDDGARIIVYRRPA